MVYVLTLHWFHIILKSPKYRGPYLSSRRKRLDLLWWRTATMSPLLKLLYRFWHSQASSTVAKRCKKLYLVDVKDLQVAVRNLRNFLFWFFLAKRLDMANLIWKMWCRRLADTVLTIFSSFTFRPYNTILCLKWQYILLFHHVSHSGESCRHI